MRSGAASLTSTVSLEAVADATSDGWVAITRTELVSVSASLARRLGTTADELRRDPWSFIHPDDLEPITEWVRSLNPDVAGAETLDWPLRVRTAADRTLWFEARALCVGDGTTVVLYRDVTETVLAAATDATTGLPNRASAIADIETLLQREPAAVAVIGIQRLRAALAGMDDDTVSAVLRQVAVRLRMLVGGDGVIARGNDDEFVVAVVASHALTPERLQRTVSGDYAVGDGQELSLRCAVGWAASNDTSAAELVARAEAARHHAEDGHVSVAVWTSALHSEREQRRETERALRDAVASGDLVVHYQPEVDLVTRRVIAAEALVRWMHPERGLLLPAEFVPIAEESGLISAIGSFVLRQACSHALSWPLPLGVRVNVAGVQVAQRGFADEVLGVLRSSGLAPERLRLEITETGKLTADETVIENLRALREAGIGIDLDDFGTGYGALAHLRTLPVDGIKLDKSFVQAATAGSRGAKLVRSLVALAAELELGLVGEGVETEEHVQELLALGCERAQGFLFSPAVPSSEFAESLVGARAA